MALLPEKKCLKWQPKLTTHQVRLSYIRQQIAAANVLSPEVYATDNQCSSVGRTQPSDAGVGDKSAVGSQVAWDVAGQTPMNNKPSVLSWSSARQYPSTCVIFIIYINISYCWPNTATKLYAGDTEFSEHKFISHFHTHNFQYVQSNNEKQILLMSWQQF